MSLFGLPVQVFSAPTLYPFSISQACNINGYGCYSSIISNYQLDPFNPNLIFMPIGITDYGIAVQNNNVYEYSYTTNEVVGFIYLSQFSSQPDDQCNSLTYNNAGSGQLNAVLVINAKDGKTYYLWAQDTVDINNDEVHYRPVDNIWELDSNDYILNNNLLSGQGSIENYQSYNEVFYAYETHSHPLVYPFAIYLVMDVYLNNSYPVIQFGYSTDGDDIIWYDNVTVDIPSVSAYFQVSPQLTPANYPEDLELIIGGLGGGDCIYIDQINGYLALLYNNNGVLTPVPYVFNYGLLTAETSTNMNPYLVSSTEVSLDTGYFYPNYLGSTQSLSYSVTIYNPINNTYDTQTYPIILYKEYNFSSIINVSGGYYQLNGIYVNNVLQKGSSVDLLIDQSYFIEPSYTLYYYVTITMPGGEYYVNGQQYIGRNTFSVPDGTTLTIDMDKYYYYNNYRYVCPNEINITVSGPENIDLTDYCTLEYYVQINSELPVNITVGGITITNITTYSDYIPLGQSIYIHKSVLIKDHFFYYTIYTIDSQYITVLQPLNISLTPTITKKLNYLTISGTAIATISSISIISIVLKHRKKKVKQKNK